MRRSLHLVLALSLLLLSWFQLQHELTAHVHNAGHGCEICIFTGHLADGAPVTTAVPAVVHLPFHFEANHYDAPTLAQPFRLAFSQRAPPRHSPV